MTFSITRIIKLALVLALAPVAAVVAAVPDALPAAAATTWGHEKVVIGPPYFGPLQDCGVGVDAHGDVFMCDGYADSQILELPPGSTTPIALPLELPQGYALNGMAVDSAGTVYAMTNGIHGGGGPVIELKNGIQQTLATPVFDVDGSIAADQFGDVFVGGRTHADGFHIVEISHGSMKTLAFPSAGGVATDAFGSLYVADGGPEVVKIDHPGSSNEVETTLRLSDTSAGTDKVTVDLAGNVYVSWKKLVGCCSLTGGVVEFSGGTETSLDPVLVDRGGNFALADAPAGLATDSAGDLYVGTSSGVLEFPVFTAAAPSFTTADHVTCTAGDWCTFQVEADGEPWPSLTESGAMPDGLSFTDDGHGVGTLQGVIAANPQGGNPAGDWTLTFDAANPSGDASQNFTLTVLAGNQTRAPTFTSPAQAAFTVGTYGSFIITTDANPTASITESGALPPGLTFHDQGSGFATISGTATGVGNVVGGSVAITLTASNGISPDASQSFALFMGSAPTITSPDHTHFAVGSGNGFTVTTTGLPSPRISETGLLPSGVSFFDNQDGTATLFGIPAAGSDGTYPLFITADNGNSPTAAQQFTLVVGTGGPAPTTTTVGASSNPSSYGDPVTFTATVAAAPPAAGVPTGTASFRLGSKTLCAAVPLDSTGKATCPTSALPAGNEFVAADYAGSSSFQASTGGTTLTVAPAHLSVTPSSAAMTYGSVPPAISPSYSGFVNGDTPASLTALPTCSTTATASSPVGTYPSSCTGAVDANYTISYATGTVTVGPAHLTVTASSPAMTYGGTPPSISPSYSGFVNGDTPASLTTLPTCSTTATASSPVGSYPSSCSGAVDSKYTISYAGGTVTVNPAPLTVTPADQTKTYGAADPTFTFTITGFVDGQNGSVLTSQPTCVVAGLHSNVGTYSITCSGGGAPNYTLAYRNATLTVAPAHLTVTASSAAMTYGSVPPAITPSYNGFVNGDTPASLTAAPTCSTAATASSPVGTYPSSCTGAVDANYNVSYVAGKVVISPVPTSLVGLPQIVLSPLGLHVLSVSATLTSAKGPLAGQTITFSAGSTTLCTSVTNSAGVATCTLSLVDELAVILNLGYSQSYAGSLDFSGSATNTPLASGH